MENKRIEQLEKENCRLKKQIKAMINCDNCSNVYNKNVWDILEEYYQEPCASCENHSKWKLKTK